MKDDWASGYRAAQQEFASRKVALEQARLCNPSGSADEIVAVAATFETYLQGTNVTLEARALSQTKADQNRLSAANMQSNT